MNIETRIRRIERSLRYIRPLVVRVYNRDYRIKRDRRAGMKEADYAMNGIRATIKSWQKTAEILGKTFGKAKVQGRVPVYLKREQLHKLRMFLDRDNRKTK